VYALAKLLIVASRRNFEKEARTLIVDLLVGVVPVTAASTQRVAQAYRQWGKGVHPAKLNYGDCFAYALARKHNLALLYVGQNFTQTDVLSAL